MLPVIIVTHPDGSATQEAKPLEINVDQGNLSVGDVRLMKGYAGASDPAEAVALLGEFLIKHTNWTTAEVNQIQAEELVEVMHMIQAAEAAKGQAVPLAKSPRLKGGRAVKSMHPNGV